MSNFKSSDEKSANWNKFMNNLDPNNSQCQKQKPS